MPRLAPGGMAATLGMVTYLVRRACALKVESGGLTLGRTIMPVGSFQWMQVTQERGGRLGREVTDQTQAIQNIADSSGIAVGQEKLEFD